MIFYLVAILFSPSDIIAKGRIYVVAVGIADYPGSDSDLMLPAKDAYTMAALYKLYNNASTALLIDSRATRSEILKKMDKYYSAASPDDIVVFFFSGHGCSSGFCAYDDILTYSDVRKSLSKSRAGSKIVFADACLAGGLRSNGGQSGSAVQDGYREISGQNGIMLFLSSRSDELSNESSGMPNGLFTYALQRGLRGAADTNYDRTITAIELYRFVSDVVVLLSAGSQHPVMWGKFNNNMPVMIW